MIKLIASDVDGTLVKDGAKEVGEDVFAMIRACCAQGLYFAVASGRPYAMVRQEFLPVYEDAILIGDAGAQAHFNGEVLYTHVMDRAASCRVVEDIRQSEGCEAIVSTAAGRVVILPKSDVFRERVCALAPDSVDVVQSIDEVEDGIVKVTAFVANGGAEALVPDFKQKWGSEVNVMAAGRFWVDFCGTGKEHAIAALMERFGLAPEEVMVFGDNENDLGMMRLAGHAYAMEEAKEEIRRACGNTCSSVPEVVHALLAAQRN